MRPQSCVASSESPGLSLCLLTHGAWAGPILPTPPAGTRSPVTGLGTAVLELLVRFHHLTVPPALATHKLHLQVKGAGPMCPWGTLCGDERGVGDTAGTRPKALGSVTRAACGSARAIQVLEWTGLLLGSTDSSDVPATGPLASWCRSQARNGAPVSQLRALSAFPGWLPPFLTPLAACSVKLLHFLGYLLPLHTLFPVPGMPCLHSSFNTL